MWLPFERLHEAALRQETDRRLAQIDKNTLTYDSLQARHFHKLDFAVPFNKLSAHFCGY
jgi:hypothetical protein